MAAFKSTLEVVKDADLLLHMVDSSHELAREQTEAVYQVLQELGVTDKPILTVYNKVDRLSQHEGLRRRLEQEDNALCISARTGEGVPELLETLARLLGQDRVEADLCIPTGKAGWPPGSTRKPGAFGRIRGNRHPDPGQNGQGPGRQTGALHPAVKKYKSIE